MRDGIALTMGFLRDQLQIPGLRPAPADPTPDGFAGAVHRLLHDGFLPSNADRLRDLCTGGDTVDWLFALTHKRHRDHRTHQWLVTAVGLFLLEVRLANGRVLRDIVAQAVRDRSDRLRELHGARGAGGATSGPGSPTEMRDTARAAWLVGASLHDHAYPLAHILKTLDYCEQLDPPQKTKAVESLRGLLEGVAPCYSESLYELLDPSVAQPTRLDALHSLVYDQLVHLWDALTAEEVAGWCALEHLENGHRAAEGEGEGQSVDGDEDHCGLLRHGLCGALNLALTMGQGGVGATTQWFTSPTHSLHMAAVSVAMRAMALHDAPAGDGTAPCAFAVDVERDPLDFLLVLCDEVQDWDRTVAVEGRAVHEQTEVILKGIEQDGRGRWYLSDALEVTFRYPNSDALKMSEWNYDLFVDSKSRAFRRLRPSVGEGKALGALRFGTNTYDDVT